MEDVASSLLMVLRITGDLNDFLKSIKGEVSIILIKNDIRSQWSDLTLVPMITPSSLLTLDEPWPKVNGTFKD